MTPRLVACTKCRAPLPPVLYNAPDLLPCPSCKARTQIEIFPAALRPAGPAAVGRAVMGEGEASCFYHPAKQAVRPCESCGRFLCALCDVELNDQHICPACLAAGKRKGTLRQFENRRTLYDNLALSVAFFPMLLVWPSLLGAPIALYIAIRYWKTPSSIVPRTRWRSVVAIILALLQIGGWVAMLIVLLDSRGS